MIRRLAAALGLLVVLTTIATEGESAEAARSAGKPSAVTAETDAYEQGIVDRINLERVAKKLPKLVVGPAKGCLEENAESWSKHLAATGKFERQDLQAVITQCHLAGAGELLVRNPGLSTKQAVDAWMASKRWRAIILKDGFYTHVAVGAWVDAKGVVTVAALFGA